MAQQNWKKAQLEWFNKHYEIGEFEEDICCKCNKSLIGKKMMQSVENGLCLCEKCWMKKDRTHD